MGISLTFLGYFLPTLCNTSTVFYFCAFISLVEITTGFHGWPICFSYWIQDKYFVEIWDQNTSFCIILSRFFIHRPQCSVVSGVLPALRWRACASPPLDPVTSTNRETPDTPKAGVVLCETGPKSDPTKMSVLDLGTSASSVPYCTTNVRKLLCIISLHNSCIDLDRSQRSISML